MEDYQVTLETKISIFALQQFNDKKKTQSLNERVKNIWWKKLLSNMVWTESSVEMLITDIIIMKHYLKKF